MSSNKPSSVAGRRSLVLTGFMGTGKTSVGKVIAQELTREFVDIDAVIEMCEGKTVREIFATSGELYFRVREVELCTELGKRKNLVIATGGGALVDARNRAAFANAFVVCLDASMDEIIARIGGVTNRPMIAGDARQRIETLLRERQPAYAQIQQHIDTTNKTVEQVAAQVITLFQQDEHESGN